MNRDMPANPFKRALAARTPQLGFWLNLASPTVTEIAAGAGFDWLLIDMEHSPNELADIYHHLRAASGYGAEPVVRVPWNEPVLVKRLLDGGVRSVMFPMVQSVEEAKAAVAATRYPPAGIRGFVGGGRASGYGRIAGYAAHCAEEICVVVQIETPKGLEAIGDIASVEGVDGVFIGPADLAANMGYLSASTAEPVQAAVREGLHKILDAGMAAPGMIEPRAQARKALFEAGFVFVAAGSDVSMVARGTEALVGEFRSAASR